jgi:hypothetical protein
MKVEFNGKSYNIGNRAGHSACTGCIVEKSLNLKCPADSEGQCILPLDKIYTDLCSNQVFKL